MSQEHSPATLSEGGPCEVPLTEQLRSVPKDFRTSRAIQWSEDGRETGHQYIPVGFMMHRAADEIEKLQHDLERSMANHNADLNGTTVSETRRCPYCTSDNEGIRDTYFDQTCAGCVRRMGGSALESVDEVLSIVETYGPWGTDINESLRYQIVLADEVKKLRSVPSAMGKPIPIAEATMPMLEALKAPCRHCGKRPIDTMDFS